MSACWTLNVVSASTDEQAIVRSMLVLLKGHFVDPWRIGERHEADLLLVRGIVPVPAFDAEPERCVVARFIESTDPRPADDSLTIVRPLHVKPFLELLNKAGHRLRQRHAAGPAAPAVAPTAQPDSTLAASLLHQMRTLADRQAGVALTADDGSELAIVLVDRRLVASTLHSAALLEALDRRGRLLPLAQFDARQRQLIDSHSRPLDALCWQAGAALAARAGLAPWLNKDHAYRLIAWPDFGVIGVIGADKTGFRLSAMLTKQAIAPSQLAAQTAFDGVQVASFFNSASLCGLLATGIPQAADTAPVPSAAANTPSPAIAAAGPTSLQRSLIGRLRAKLGL